jgi:hypothetical protein
MVPVSKNSQGGKMFSVHTKSGAVYTIDTVNMRSLRASSTPLETLFTPDYISNDWQDIKSWQIVPRQGFIDTFDSLFIEYKDGSYSYSTEVLRVEQITPETAS